jgi:hypothetical protein
LFHIFDLEDRSERLTVRQKAGPSRLKIA